MMENESLTTTLQNAIDCATDDITREDLEMMVKCLEELQQYRTMEQRLQKVYGECEGLLETVVQHLENHENIESPDNIIKARLLTDEDVDKWEEYRAIGTVEEIKSMKDNGAFSGIELAQIASMQMKLKEYQSIGTIDEFKALKEKSVAKKAKWHPNPCAEDNRIPICPNCNTIMVRTEIFGRTIDEHCVSCGQAIDWSE